MGIDADLPVGTSIGGKTYAERMARIFGHVNVKWFGATGDGTTNDAAAIMAAIDLAFLIGPTIGGNGNFPGMIVFFPPGVFNCGSTRINNFGQNHASIRLIGSGFKTTFIQGYVEGYLIDKSNTTLDSIEEISHMAVKNYYPAPQCGAIRLHGTHHAKIQSCVIYGHNGVDAASASYHTTISECNISGLGGAAASGVGAYITQTQMTGCRFTGCSTGIQFHNVGTLIQGTSLEVCGTAIFGGGRPRTWFRADFDGTEMTVTNHLAGPRIPTSVEFDIVGTGLASETHAIAWVSGGDGENTVLEGVMTIDTNPGVLSDVLCYIDYGTSAPGHYTIDTVQTEACDTAIQMWSGSNGKISSIAGTGTVGPYDAVTNSSLTWDAGGGGIATVTTAAPHIFVANQKVVITGVTPSGYNDVSGGNPANVVRILDTPSSTTFRIPLTSNPGSASSVHGTTAGYVRYGLRMGTLNNCVVEVAGSSGHCAANFDLLNDNYTGPIGVTMLSCIGSWIDPPAGCASSYRLVGCNHHIPLDFADLPGESGNQNQSVVVGEQWIIDDGESDPGGIAAVPGNTVRGTGSQRLIVAHSGSAWKCVAVLS